MSLVSLNRAMHKLYMRHQLSVLHSTPRFSRGLTLFTNNDDFIDAEIVGENSKNTDKFNLLKRSESPTDKKSRVNSIFNSIATFFGQDEKSIQKRKRKKELNTAIDSIFEGSGLLGTVFKSVAKGVGGMIADAVAESSNDFQTIQLSVEEILENSADAKSVLGSDVSCAMPISSSSSSISVNGEVSKFIQMIMPVTGSMASGQARVECSFSSSGKLQITDVIVATQFSGSVTILDKRNKSRGSGTGGSSGFIDV